MNWTEVNIFTTTEGIDPVCGCLLTVGITGFVIKDSKDFEDFLNDCIKVLELYADFGLAFVPLPRGRFFTVIVQRSFFVPTFAVIFAFPALTVVILPFLETVTTDFLLELHLTLLEVPFTFNVEEPPVYKVSFCLFSFMVAASVGTPVYASPASNPSTSSREHVFLICESS